jgi:hypothetical protein
VGGQALDLEAGGGADEGLEVAVGDAHLSVVHELETRGRCLVAIFGEKLEFFSKTNVMIKSLHNFCAKMGFYFEPKIV